MESYRIVLSLAVLTTVVVFSCQPNKNAEQKEAPLNVVKTERKQDAEQLTGHRFLTFNTVIRVNQIEVARDKNVGRDERDLHTPEKVIKFREAIEKGFPGSRITWAFSWLALNDTTTNYKTIRELVVGYHYRYGDEITFINNDLADAVMGTFVMGTGGTDGNAGQLAEGDTITNFLGSGLEATISYTGGDGNDVVLPLC